MNLKKAIKDLFTLCAVYYTVLSVLIIVIGIILSEDSASKILVPKQFLYLLFFSFVMSLGSALKKITAYPTAIAYSLHAVCYVFGFMAFLILCGMKFVPVIIATSVFAVLYTAEQLISKIIGKRSGKAHALRKEKSDSMKTKTKANKRSVEYVSQFSSNSREDK